MPGLTRLATFARFAPRNPHRTASVRLRLRVAPTSRISSKRVSPRCVISRSFLVFAGRDARDGTFYGPLGQTVAIVSEERATHRRGT